jgi:hypothetical protein
MDETFPSIDAAEAWRVAVRLFTEQRLRGDFASYDGGCDDVGPDAGPAGRDWLCRLILDNLDAIAELAPIARRAEATLVRDFATRVRAAARTCRVCAQCGAGFSSRGRDRCCSNACRRAAAAARNGEAAPTAGRKKKGK